MQKIFSQSRKQILIIILSVFFLTVTVYSTDIKYDNVIILQLYEGPTKNLVWEIALFRKNEAVWFQNKNYKNKTWKKKISNDEYKSMMKAVHNSGIMTIVKSQKLAAGAAFYSITTGNSLHTKTIKVQAYPPYSGVYSNIQILIREFQNYARLYSYE